MLLGAAALIVAFQWTHWAGIPFYFAAPVALIGVRHKANVWALAGAAAVTLLYGLSVLVPPGIDSAMHSAIAKIIAETAGLATSFRPLWPLDRFDSYPFGQPTLVAYVHLLVGEPRAAATWGMALTFGLVTLAFVTAALRMAGRSDTRATLIALAALGMANAPLGDWNWGGGPNALGLGLAALAFTSEKPLEKGLFAAAAFLTHATGAVAIAIIALPFLRRQWFIAGAFALVLIVPFLANMRPALGEAEKAWAIRWMHQYVDPNHLPSTAWLLLPRTLHDSLLVFVGLAIAWLVYRRRLPRHIGVFIAMTLVLLIVPAFSVLPLSSILYPERIAELLLLPCTVLLIHAADDAGRLFVPAMAVACVIVGVRRAQLLDNGRAHSVVTANDIQGLRAIESSFPPGCTVIANYGDAGQWLPALTSHPSSYPHVHVVWFDEVGETQTPCAAFKGDKLAYDTDNVTAQCERFGCEPLGYGAYRLLRPEPIRVTGAR